MAVRTVSVRLRAEVGDYMAKLGAASKATSDFAGKVQKDAVKHKQAWTEVGHGLEVGGALMAVGVGLAVKSMMDFDAQMSQVQTLSHATADEMHQLRDAALHLGQGIGFSAKETAEAETELVKAGVSVKDIMGGALKGALDLAAAGQVDVADATETAAIAMTQFKLAGKDVPHIADLLAAGADKALGGVGDLSYALKSGGLVAAQFGLSIEDTVGTLAAFAQAGLLGSSAGTTMRQMLLQLTSPSQQAAGLMQQLGLHTYDTAGKFVGITKLAGQLHDKLSGLTQAERDNALAVIFGAHAIQGANVLYQEGAAGIAGWIRNVNDAGFAAHQAAGKMDNLKGDLSKLRAAFENDLIESGSGANGALREITRSGTTALHVFGEMPALVQHAALGLGAATAATALLGGAVITAIPRIVAFNKSLEEMGIAGRISAAGIGKVGLAIGVVTATVAAADVGSTAFRKWIGDTVKDGPKAAATLEQIARSGKVTDSAMDDLGAHATSLHDALHSVFDRSAWENITAGLNKIGSLGGALPWGDDQVNAARRFFKSIDAGLAELVSDGKTREAAAAFATISDQAKKQGVTMGQLMSQLPMYAAAVKGAGEQQKALGDATGGANQQLQEQAKALGDVEDRLKELGQLAVDATKAEIDYQAAIDDATKAIKDNGAKLTLHHGQLVVNSAAQRNLAQALIAVRDNAHQVTKSMLDQRRPADEIIARARDAYRSFIGLATQMGLTRGQARNLAHQFGLFPADVKTQVETPGLGLALDGVSRLRAALINLPNHKDVAIRVTQYGDVRQGVVRGHRAGGGDVEGGSTYLVGERGPELFTAPSSGRIIANDRLRLAPFDPGRHAPAGMGGDYGQLVAALGPHLKGTQVTVPTQIIGDPSSTQTALWAHDAAHALRSALG